MTANIFLDTNIVLDFLDDQRLHHENSQRLIRQLTQDNWRITMSEDMLSTIFYIRKNPNVVLEFYQYILRHWEIVSYGRELMQEAVNLAQKYAWDLEDTLQCLCAKKEDCAIIVTEDKAFVDCGVEILDYKGFLS